MARNSPHSDFNIEMYKVTKETISSFKLMKHKMTQSNTTTNGSAAITL